MNGSVMSMGNTTGVADLLHRKRVIVCCGAGGVGKTTVSASLALAAARRGLRVLVVTIDPSKRLAETLGVKPNQPAPVMLSTERMRKVGVKGPGSLSAWMLDPQLVSDHVVNNVSKSGQDASVLLKNRIYKNISAMIAGMQEYTAVEALHGFIVDDRYDLVVLDTPPSRNALRFLESPTRANAFLDKRVFSLFVPDESSALGRAASKVVSKVLDLALGEESRRDLQEFLKLFQVILTHLNHNQSEMRDFFAGDDVTFLLVTSPQREAVNEAFYFEQKTKELRLPLGGFVLNRSLVSERDRPYPSAELAPDGPPALVSALEKLGPLADAEVKAIEAHTAIATELEGHAGDPNKLWILPRLADASELGALDELANLLTGEDPHPTGEHAAVDVPMVHVNDGLPSTDSWFPPPQPPPNPDE